MASLEKHPTFTAPGPALDVNKIPKSSKIVVIDNSPSVGPLVNFTAGIIQAAKRTGFKPTLLNGGSDNTASDDINLLEQAVNLHPKVVIQVGIIVALEKAGLEYAKAHGVPVIAAGERQPTPGVKGQGSGPLVAATTADAIGYEGKLIAEYVGSHGPSNAQIGIIGSNELVSANEVYANFKSELAKICPHCTTVTANVSPEDWTSQLTPTVTSMIDSHPTMDYLFPLVDGMVPWVTPATNASTRKLSIVTTSGTPGSAMAAVKAGKFAAEAGASTTLMGWYAWDAALRAMLKMPAEKNPTEPTTFFTTASMNAQKLNPSSTTSLYGDSFQAGFLKLWGVKSS